MRTHLPGYRSGLPIALVAAGLTTFLLIGCSATDGTPAPTAASAPSATAPKPTADLTLLPTDPAATPKPTPPSQTDTPWGRIWDGLPADFPIYPGVRPTETGQGPASAILDAGTADPGMVMNFYQSALEAAGWITVSSSGPREDGSRELASVNIHPACQLQITVTPLGGSTIVTILFGAGCPFS
ncbi:MAG: hypothetical protein V4515_13995 [Chloroflexota bacterium]